jgi:hypothetical protein
MGRFLNRGRKFMNHVHSFLIYQNWTLINIGSYSRNCSCAKLQKLYPFEYGKITIITKSDTKTSIAQQV